MLLFPRHPPTQRQLTYNLDLPRPLARQRHQRRNLVESQSFRMRVRDVERAGLAHLPDIDGRIADLHESGRAQVKVEMVPTAGKWTRA
jgi:hypothetical protein